MPLGHRTITQMGTAAIAAFGLALAAATDASAGRAMLQNAKSWTYQLQGSDRAAASSADVVIVDQSAAGNLSRLKQKPGGGRRAAIGYLSIGEAEPWRPYWKSCCSGGNRPSWLTSKTQGWKSNYVVKYWEPGWKAIVRERVGQMMRAGFDGIYIDRVDTWENVKAPGSSRAEMIQLVREVASAARSIKGDAAILVQNGEELLSDAGYVSAIDGIAKESLYYGTTSGIGKRNSVGDINSSLGPLKHAKARGKAVLVVEYIGDNAAVAAEIRSHGFVPNFAKRGL
jgi:cysteinyl-tRNA synthetase, unknown class